MLGGVDGDALLCFCMSHVSEDEWEHRNAFLWSDLHPETGRTASQPHSESSSELNEHQASRYGSLVSSVTE